MIAAVSLTFLMPNKSFACIYKVPLFLDHPRQSENWVKDSDPWINNAFFCEGVLNSGTTQCQNFFPAPISLSGEKHTIASCYVGILSISSEKN